VTLEPDVAAAIDRLRRDEGLGLSEAVNRLVRAGLAAAGTARPRYVHRPRPLGIKVDVSDVARAIEELEGPLWR
jgi:hypothetical protein